MAADININMEIQFDESVGSLCEGSERLLEWKSGPAYGLTDGLTGVGARDVLAHIKIAQVRLPCLSLLSGPCLTLLIP